jgi:hypothetical protein
MEGVELAQRRSINLLDCISLAGELFARLTRAGGSSRKGIFLLKNAGSCVQEFRGMPGVTRLGLANSGAARPLNKKRQAVQPMERLRCDWQ